MERRSKRKPNRLTVSTSGMTSESEKKKKHANDVIDLRRADEIAQGVGAPAVEQVQDVLQRQKYKSKRAVKEGKATETPKGAAVKR
jgi:1,6-anhydro-N-acetylmuramate kinase